MTLSLFFLTLIPLEDKWNHMLGAGPRKKKNKVRPNEVTFSMIHKRGAAKRGQNRRIFGLITADFVSFTKLSDRMQLLELVSWGVM